MSSSIYKSSAEMRKKMIINTGGRTDTVQYYTEWLLNRFSEGYALSRNPLFTSRVMRYELTPDKVDCVVFCSKNLYCLVYMKLQNVSILIIIIQLQLMEKILSQAYQV